VLLLKLLLLKHLLQKKLRLNNLYRSSYMEKAVIQVTAFFIY